MKEEEFRKGIDETISIDKTLSDRGNIYGDFAERARITQNIKRAMKDSPNWEQLPDYMKQALEMDAEKIGRILNGNPYYIDNWHDIIGYTRLVETTLLTGQNNRGELTNG